MQRSWRSWWGHARDLSAHFAYRIGLPVGISPAGVGVKNWPPLCSTSTECTPSSMTEASQEEKDG